VSGGKGADTVTLNGGGIYTFAKGDGTDFVTMDKAVADKDDVNQAPVNRVVIDGYAFADLTMNLLAVSVSFTPNGSNPDNDSLAITREVMGRMEIVFRKNGQQQTLTIDGLTQTMGPMGPATP
jgi:hypothetical protein